jgi:hypothetical protein
MIGEATEDQLGLIPRCCAYIFSKIEELPPEVEVKMKVSMLEIYNEKFRDLLQPRDHPNQQKLKLTQTKSGGFKACDPRCATTVPWSLMLLPRWPAWFDFLPALRTADRSLGEYCRASFPAGLRAAPRARRFDGSDARSTRAWLSTPVDPCD